MLKAYGGGQNRANGEMYFYGVFLLPKRGNSIRSEFIVKEESIAFIQVVPKYKVNVNDIVIELYYGREKIQRTMYTAYNGLVIAFLPQTDYYVEGENELNCYLDVTFDRHRSSCEAFALLFSLIPENAYRDVYMNCTTINNESDEEQLPSSLTLSNTNVYQYSSHVHKGFVKINGFNVGRYFNDAGPQRTLFVPATKLKNGKNEVLVFESDFTEEPKVEFFSKPDLGNL